MSASVAVIPGSALPLTLQLEDGDATKFPQAAVYSPAGVLLTTLDLAHVATGLSTNTTYVMPSEDWVAATYVVYDDAGHTVESSIHLRAQDTFVGDQGVIALQSSLETLRKESTNREEVNFITSKIEAYDDDGLTVIQRWPVTDNDDNAVVAQPGAITKRGAPEL